MQPSTTSEGGMPVTAKLSRRFYEQFGDELTNELVEWLNSVDSTYRSDLRDMNELNFARFDAKLEQRAAGIEARIDGLDAKFDHRLAVFEAKFDQRIGVLEAKTDQRIGILEAKVDQWRAELNERLAVFETRMIRWMFALWTSTMLAFGGLLFAVLRS